MKGTKTVSAFLSLYRLLDISFVGFITLKCHLHGTSMCIGSTPDYSFQLRSDLVVCCSMDFQVMLCLHDITYTVLSLAASFCCLIAPGFCWVLAFNPQF